MKYLEYLKEEFNRLYDLNDIITHTVEVFAGMAIGFIGMYLLFSLI